MCHNHPSIRCPNHPSIMYHNHPSIRCPKLPSFLQEFFCLFKYNICPLPKCQIINLLYRFCLYLFYWFIGPVPIGLFTKDLGRTSNRYPPIFTQTLIFRLSSSSHTRSQQYHNLLSHLLCFFSWACVFSSCLRSNLIFNEKKRSKSELQDWAWISAYQSWYKFLNYNVAILQWFI
jgi:hypothetical protein